MVMFDGCEITKGYAMFQLEHKLPTPGFSIPYPFCRLFLVAVGSLNPRGPRWQFLDVLHLDIWNYPCQTPFQLCVNIYIYMIYTHNIYIYMCVYLYVYVFIVYLSLTIHLLYPLI